MPPWKLRESCFYDRSIPTARMFLTNLSSSWSICIEHMRYFQGKIKRPNHTHPFGTSCRHCFMYGLASFPLNLTPHKAIAFPHLHSPFKSMLLVFLTTTYYLCDHRIDPETFHTWNTFLLQKIYSQTSKCFIMWTKLYKFAG